MSIQKLSTFGSSGSGKVDPCLSDCTIDHPFMTTEGMSLFWPNTNANTESTQWKRQLCWHYSPLPLTLEFWIKLRCKAASFSYAKDAVRSGAWHSLNTCQWGTGEKRQYEISSWYSAPGSSVSVPERMSFELYKPVNSTRWKGCDTEISNIPVKLLKAKEC